MSKAECEKDAWEDGAKTGTGGRQAWWVGPGSRL